jgi:amino acid transporter
MLCINLLPVKYYGRVEYLVGSVKITFLVALIMINVVVNARQAFHSSRFWTYSYPYDFGKAFMLVKNDTVPPVIYEGSKATFAAFWTAMSVSFFSVMGWDIMFVTAPENKDPETNETVKISARKLALRVMLLYCLAVFTVGLNVPSDDAPLAAYEFSDINAGQNSLFIISAIRERIPFLPHFLNGFFIFSAFCTGCNALFCSGRLLHAIASRSDAWPHWGPIQSLKRRLELTQLGIPRNAIIVSWLLCFLSFMAVTKPADGSDNRSPTTTVSV